MKKSILLVAGLGLFFGKIGAQEMAPVTNTQTDLRSKITLGAKLGTNYSNIYKVENEVFNADAKFGYAAGVFFAIPLGAMYGVQPEALFTQKGFKGKGEIKGESYTFSRTTNHLDIPLLFAVKPTEFVTLLAGPVWSYLFGQTDAYTYGSTMVSNETSFSNSKLRKNTLGFTAGLDLTMKHLVVGLRVGWDLQKNNGDGTTATTLYKNNWFQGTVGYRLYR